MNSVLAERRINQLEEKGLKDKANSLKSAISEKESALKTYREIEDRISKLVEDTKDLVKIEADPKALTGPQRRAKEIARRAEESKKRKEKLLKKLEPK